MKKNFSGLFKRALPLAMCLSVAACKSTFDVKPENVVDASLAYQNIYDADAAVFGIYGKLEGIADRYTILNELRSDLVDVTPNSDKYLRQINSHTVTTDNPWADPRPWYEVILNCNDVLYNLGVMKANTRISVADYNERYSDIACLRSWLYLQVGIQYGTVPYVTDPVATVSDLADETKFPKLTFSQLLDKLVTFTESLPVNTQPGVNYRTPSPISLITTVDGYNTFKMFINKWYLLGDLNLWKGNYPQAAKWYHKLMTYSNTILYPDYPPPASENQYNTYKLGRSSDSGTTFYGDGRWINIFSSTFDDKFANEEIIWQLPFDKNFKPVNPFIDLFYNKYLVKPSTLAINNWELAVQSNGNPGDPNRGAGKSYIAGSNPYIYKQVSAYSPPFNTTGKWVIFRAALLHLHMAEAANRDGRDRLAFALVNNGIAANYLPIGVSTSTSDVTNYMQSNMYMSPSNVWTADPNPDYAFDARQGEFPRYRNAWYLAGGLRGRVSDPVVKLDSTKYFQMVPAGVQYKPVTDRPGLTVAMEDLLIREGANEMAFEGDRWQDLLRIALRRQATDPNYLGNKIAAKFDAAGDAATATAIRAKFADPKNWYLPFKLQ